jgi:hypothetical protein
VARGCRVIPTTGRPRLLLVIEPEELVLARIDAAEYAAELRLAADLLGRDRRALHRDVLDALDQALDLLEQRRCLAVAGDVAAPFAGAA